MGVASDTLANISREQWDDYKSRFVPLENELIDAYNNPALRAERMADVTNRANDAATSAVGVAQRGLSRYGQTYEGQAGLTRQADLSRATSVVDARNTNRAQMNERDKLLLSGGLTSRGV